MWMFSHRQLSLAFLTLALAWPVALSAQAPAQPPSNEGATKSASPTAQTHPNNPELWNVDAMMEEAALQIARRYNLSRSQEEYTRLLLTKRTRQFLETYEVDVRELLKESIDLRIGTKPASIEAYMKWAARAAPIYQAASKAILEGNEEWREILDDSQKKTHDADMALMRTNFTQVSKTMEDWRKGFTPVGKSPTLPPEGESPVAGSSVGNPLKSDMPKGGMTKPPVQIKRQSMEDSWLAYVNIFIDAYRLDEKQSVAARDKIHKDMRELAIKYREKRKAEFEKLDADAKAPDPKSKSQDFAKRRSELERPLREMFISMDRRLNQLLDSKQRTAVNVEKKKQLDAVYESLAGEPRDKSEADGLSPRLRTTGPSTPSSKREPPTEEFSKPAPAKADEGAKPAEDAKPPTSSPSN